MKGFQVLVQRFNRQERYERKEGNAKNRDGARVFAFLCVSFALFAVNYLPEVKRNQRHERKDPDDATDIAFLCAYFAVFAVKSWQLFETLRTP